MMEAAAWIIALASLVQTWCALKTYDHRQSYESNLKTLKANLETFRDENAFLARRNVWLEDELNKRRGLK